ncbi:serine/threonine-protein kinase grp isoform X2 [Chrysoperla carnea]|nr:serine/threonine-protein kinase grp isoform X2 [Chrysoperla carnea]
MKMIDLEKHPKASENVQKEICIHRMLNDPSIIRYYGQRKEGHKEYIFLEYAAGGELFDRIEPDVGMPELIAQKYMRQLMSGVEYLHKKGVCHRDLKPENLLLDANDNLKITDFGMATIFRVRGKERPLETRCGTLPYVAPEVLKRPYRAQPVDIWSCGIILVAMLTGELPWDKPALDCPEYHKFREEQFPSFSPWNKIGNMALSLIYSILKAEPEKRATLDQIHKNRWMCHTFTSNDEKTNCPGSPKRKCYGAGFIDDVDGKICQSQPESLRVSNINDVATAVTHNTNDIISFSQPTHLDDLLLSTQLHFTQSPVNQNHYQKLVKRMTRFFVNTNWETTVQQLCDYFDKQSFKWSINSGMVTITTMDCRNMQLVFKAHVLDMDGHILVDFRLSKGCGLEFKRRFVKIKQHFQNIIVKGAIDTLWLVPTK